MPDLAKLEALEAARFRVLPTCGSCANWRGSRATSWGICDAITYAHGKHTGVERGASAPIDGWCPKFEEATEPTCARLGAHARFYDGDLRGP